MVVERAIFETENRRSETNWSARPLLVGTPTINRMLLRRCGRRFGVSP